MLQYKLYEKGILNKGFVLSSKCDILNQKHKLKIFNLKIVNIRILQIALARTRSLSTIKSGNPCFDYCIT